MNYIAASPALLALRRGAVLASIVVAIAVVAQSLTFAFVHFTHVRFETASAKVEEKTQLAVVDAQPRKQVEIAKIEKEEEVPRKLGTGDDVLGAVSNIASGAGVVALAVLVAQSWMAVAIVAGAGVVGMHRSVRAATILTALFASALPWTSAIPSAPIWGVFCGYQPLVAASGAVHDGVRSDLTIITLHAIFPMVLLGFLVWAMTNFCLGVSAGIVKHMIDPVVEAEIAAVQAHGAGSLYASRSAGDLQRMPTAQPLAAPIRMAGDNEADRAMAELEKLAGRKRMRDGDEPLRPTGTDPLRRPI